MPKLKIIEADINRFWSHVDKKGVLMPNMLSRCWIWKPKQSGHEYGTFYFANRDWFPHVFSWYVAYHSERPKGIDLHHLCRNTRCVNPNHLATVPRSTHRYLEILAKLNIPLYCKHGHVYDAANSYADPTDGQRRCLKCADISRGKYNNKHKQLGTTPENS